MNRQLKTHIVTEVTDWATRSALTHLAYELSSVKNVVLSEVPGQFIVTALDGTEATFYVTVREARS